MMITFLRFETGLAFDIRGALRRRAAQSSLALAALLGALAGGPGAPPAAAAPPAEVSFGEARLKDDLAGELTAPLPSARIRFRASAGSTLSLTLGKDDRAAVAVAPGLALSLALADGTDLSASLDGRTSVKADGTVKWNKVPLATTGEYDLRVTSSGPGTWRLRFAGTMAKTKAVDTTQAVPGTQDDLEFDGFARGTLSYKFAPTGKNSRFKGEATRIEQPDGSDLPDFVGAANGKVTLLQDGRHRLVFANTGSGPGEGQTTATVTPAKLVARTGFLHEDTTALVPVVQSVDPAKSFNKDAALPFTVTGRDFQPGADVRLTLNGRTDIVATAVDVLSETTITCLLDLDTLDTEGVNSIGTWKVNVWNDPARADPATRNAKVSFQSLASGSITLPPGVKKGAEVWYVKFNSDFQTDLNRMGFDSADDTARGSARNAIEAYTIAFLRDLFAMNETTGELKSGKSVPVCFIVAEPGRVAGTAGQDYNRIEVGGEWVSGDERSPAEPLLWGYAATNPGNTRREDLSVLDSSGARVGHGARIRVLDPTAGQVATSFALAMQPLRTRPLTASDVQYFRPGFFPDNQNEADRYREIVQQTTRASREIAAIVAHHVAKAMGQLAGSSTGPLSNPTLAGEMWPLQPSLAFNPMELADMRAAAVPHELPGSSKALTVGYFPLITTHNYLLEECLTTVAYSTRFAFVGGRPNAERADFRVQYVAGSSVPLGLRLSYDGLDGIAPLWVNQAANQYYCAIQIFRVAVTDQVRGGTKFFQYRLNVVPNVPLLPAPLQPAAQACVNTVRSTP